MANTTGKKFGGREKGVPNKDVAKTRQMIERLVKDNFSQLQLDIASLEPRDRVQAIISLLKYCTPTFKAIELTDETNSPQLFRTIYINTKEDETTED